MKLEKTINFGGKLSFFLLIASTAATYIFTAPACTTTIITLEPFELSFNKISLLYGYH
jgi:hypothetical protein